MGTIQKSEEKQGELLRAPHLRVLLSHKNNGLNCCRAGNNRAPISETTFTLGTKAVLSLLEQVYTFGPETKTMKKSGTKQIYIYIYIYIITKASKPREWLAGLFFSCSLICCVSGSFASWICSLRLCPHPSHSTGHSKNPLARPLSAPRGLGGGALGHLRQLPRQLRSLRLRLLLAQRGPARSPAQSLHLLTGS